MQFRFPSSKGQVDKWDSPMPKNTIIWYPSPEALAQIMLHGEPCDAFICAYASLMNELCYQSQARN